ncbi:uncharacterized protein CELE_C05B5.1 [Caenorhabditis elegans]|uniref:Uncharacterized protein C05B5.1 n=1 Tax=Caenorhabditis elegans TaxID=6239 RepID=YKO1_CAEEL|nr:Uncharacterized protein CELE_C05B5.1 [Caenorhabditis elegans]P34289.3 RecName: Full=Uncharacterized protein C05B5.1; Flags: Precursor [Caenorhabditis elegans]CAA83590.2 Uncharacterized protein CELE_C05B5.1 [Caenorhabditis elegans]|eukprot:NP_499215.2 Uncharacterized protein CELE_C05B5.1 [Caenorhabditis elegans]
MPSKVCTLILLFSVINQMKCGSTTDCAMRVFKETIKEMSEVADLQLETLQNLSPDTKRQMKIAIMDVLTSMGLFLEMSTASSFSFATLPIYMLRAQNLMNLLSMDLENLQPEQGTLSESVEKMKNMLISVVNTLPKKAMICFQME